MAKVLLDSYDNSSDEDEEVNQRGDDHLLKNGQQ